jgi:hypothetical protein
MSARKLVVEQGPRHSVTNPYQPEPRIIENPPAQTVAQALANSNQVGKAK